MDTIKDEFIRLCETDKYLIESNLHFIGKGSGRKVYAIDENYVIKVPRNTSGVLQNKVENNIFNSANESLKEYLCPIEYYKNDIIIMKRALPLNSIITNRGLNMLQILNTRKKSEFFKEMKPLLKYYDLLYEDIIAISSWGILNNKPVLIDYGCTNKIYDKYLV
ncbi:hypothetical protein [Clostridium omnivorum]|uniref:Serine/threonine protein kinase n=1 Tax=Clostridium omnivorum TaxID=1604902 RepID=A0ABQ5NAY1_9CLOT|nr:hypothetical protein [Clostridium sp. E14]GLC32227.1 hypothetical protein bsdE14_36370 [Clostridium sp. E14]